LTVNTLHSALLYAVKTRSAKTGGNRQTIMWCGLPEMSLERADIYNKLKVTINHLNSELTQIDGILSGKSSC